ncbi:MAG: septation protein IspZ, partial [Pseudomonadota bacterium]|nr:septation protein IspZ [Pseudomonadota bacterium]
LLAMRRKVHKMLWVTFIAVTVLGGISVWLHDPIFIKWKPTIVYWASAIGLWASQAFFDRNGLKAALGGEMRLPAVVWQRLNLAWVFFFVFLGVVNLYVAYNYSVSAWATFKVFGSNGLIVVFIGAQMPYISRHLIDDKSPKALLPPQEPTK